jgi:cytoskeletal protein CcmA (bactofilin family)
MNYSSSRTSGSQKGNTSLPQPDFENNLAEFESDFHKFVAETDPNFDFNLLRFTHSIPAPETPAPQSESTYPTAKQELGKTFSYEGPKKIESSLFGEIIELKSDIRVRGSVTAVKKIIIGPNCVVEGNVSSGGLIEFHDNSRIEGSVVGSELKIMGHVIVLGPTLSRGTFEVNGTLETQALVSAKNIKLNGSENDYVKVESQAIFAQSGEIETSIPVKLGHTARVAELSTQKFYLSRSADGTLRLARMPSLYQDGIRPAQGTLITNLTDSELEKLLAELAAQER